MCLISEFLLRFDLQVMASGSGVTGSSSRNLPHAPAEPGSPTSPRGAGTDLSARLAREVQLSHIWVPTSVSDPHCLAQRMVSFSKVVSKGLLERYRRILSRHVDLERLERDAGLPDDEVLFLRACGRYMQDEREFYTAMAWSPSQDLPCNDSSQGSGGNLS